MPFSHLRLSLLFLLIQHNNILKQVYIHHFTIHHVILDENGVHEQQKGVLFIIQSELIQDLVETVLIKLLVKMQHELLF